MEGYVPPCTPPKVRLRAQEQFYLYFTLEQVFTNQGSAENHYGFPDKSWNKNKIFEMQRKTLNIPRNTAKILHF